MILLDIIILSLSLWLLATGTQYFVKIIAAKFLLDESVVILNEFNLGDLQPLLKAASIGALFTGTLLLVLYVIIHTNRKREEHDA